MSFFSFQRTKPNAAMCKRTALFFQDSVDASKLEVPCFFFLNLCLRDEVRSLKPFCWLWTWRTPIGRFSIFTGQWLALKLAADALWFHLRRFDPTQLSRFNLLKQGRRYHYAHLNPDVSYSQLDRRWLCAILQH